MVVSLLFGFMRDLDFEDLEVVPSLAILFVGMDYVRAEARNLPGLSARFAFVAFANCKNIFVRFVLGKQPPLQCDKFTQNYVVLGKF